MEDAATLSSRISFFSFWTAISGFIWLSSIRTDLPLQKPPVPIDLLYRRLHTERAMSPLVLKGPERTSS